ncbi:IS3 family transposase [Arthrobacter russicus]|jgi:putative transposase|uniref:Transposase InsO family protein n=2 Tax=Arthrobacter russicus TaxID=172040 RepID=A0ABU1J6U4_9MICC|nr:IS3 family transposase [Arthrobacter russicus]MDR6268148.1 transposase InsO family protein [Arthrobacter russicus]
MIGFIDMYRDRFGVEGICRVLGRADCGFLTARGYRAFKTRKPSNRALKDLEHGTILKALHAANYSVYGVRKLHQAALRAGLSLGRDHVARLMRVNHLHGVLRGRKPRTTTHKATDYRPDDLVNRRFTAPAPNRLWVSDITYVPTFAGFVYLAFVTDVYSRKIVGWAASKSLKTVDLPLFALNTATFKADDTLGGLVHHSDKGSQYVSIAYTDRLAQLGVKASVGSVGDSYDNALAESINAIYKTELIKHHRPWTGLQQVELATLEWVDWYNNTRLHAGLGYQSPVEYENNHTLNQTDQRAATTTLINT